MPDKSYINERNGGVIQTQSQSHATSAAGDDRTGRRTPPRERNRTKKRKEKRIAPMGRGERHAALCAAVRSGQLPSESDIILYALSSPPSPRLLTPLHTTAQWKKNLPLHRKSSRQ